MERRALLRAVAMLPFLSGGFAAFIGATKSATAATTHAKQRVRPSDPSWPDAASWAKLKDDVGGNLLEAQSLFGACETEPSGAACLDALENIGNPYWRHVQRAGLFAHLDPRDEQGHAA
jgi:hypothetical protein